jgi:hypothetical protein
MTNKAASLLLCVLVGGCGSVTATSELVASDAGADVAVEHAAAAGAGGAAAGSSGGAGAAGGAAGSSGGAGATAGSSGADAGGGPPACPFDPTAPARSFPSSTEPGTLVGMRCKDVNGLRCSTGCQDTRGYPHPGDINGNAGAPCVEPGPPWTPGIPVLCVNDCSECP